MPPGTTVFIQMINSLIVPPDRDLGGFRKTITLGQSWPTERTLKVGNENKSYPITYLDKDVIEEGQYVHPRTGRVVHATRQQIKDWVTKFNQMSESGALEPGVPVDHSLNSRDNLGFVKAARAVEFVNPATNEKRLRLRLTHAVIGEDAALIALRNRASLGIDPDYVDGKGKRWGSVIVHSAITPDPVVAGMGEFSASVTLSRGQQTEIYLLSAKESLPMLTAELRTKFAKIVDVDPADTKVTDEVLLSRVAKEFDDIETDMVDVNAELTTLSRTVAEKSSEVETLSRGATQIPDDNVLTLLSNSFATENEATVVAGGLDGATAKKVHDILCPDGKPGAIALHRNAGNLTPVYTQLMKALRDNKPVIPNGKDKTAIQLGRNAPGGGSTPEDAEAVRKRMIEKANAGNKPATRR